MPGGTGRLVLDSGAKCFSFEECDLYADTFVAAGKAVLHAEYVDASQLGAVCGVTRLLGLSTLVKHIELDAIKADDGAARECGTRPGSATPPRLAPGPLAGVGASETRWGRVCRMLASLRYAAWPLALLMAGCGERRRGPSPEAPSRGGALAIESAPRTEPPPGGRAEASSDPTLPAPKPNVIEVKRASPRYDFRLLLAAPEASDDGRTPAELVVVRKGGSEEVQKISLESVFVSVAPRGEVLVNAAELYEAQGTINVGDFDFDGSEDFAVYVGNDGPYGGPTYDVFLYSPPRRQFVHSEGLSRLTRETLGFFQTDAKRKLLLTSSKSGCCYHVREEHAVVKGGPVVVFRIIEDALTADGRVTETRERLVNSVWRRSVRRLPAPPGGN